MKMTPAAMSSPSGPFSGHRPCREALHRGETPILPGRHPLDQAAMNLGKAEVVVGVGVRQPPGDAPAGGAAGRTGYDDREGSTGGTEVTAVNRAELQQLARDRPRDAKALLAARRWAGASRSAAGRSLRSTTGSARVRSGAMTWAGCPSTSWNVVRRNGPSPVESGQVAAGNGHRPGADGLADAGLVRWNFPDRSAVW